MPVIKREEVKRLKAVPFKDCNAYKGNSGHYLATNEEPKLFNELLGDARFEKAAGICSGGEIGFFVLLPRVEKELVLVDHHYGSMENALMKWLIIQTEGAKRAHALLSKSNKELYDIVQKLVKRMPQAMRSSFKPINDRYAYTKPARICTFNRFCSMDGAHHSIQREWELITVKQVQEAEKNLTKIKFLHGDLIEDLRPRAPFGCLYVSNAMSYSGRAGIPSWDKVKSLVADGGVILTTGGHGGVQAEEIEHNVVGKKTHWHHTVVRMPAPISA